MNDRHDQQPRPLGADVQLDSADTLDGPAGGGDALDAGYIPPDRPYGLDEDGVTGAGMREGDSLDERLRREEPEDVAVDDDRSGRLVQSGDAASDGMDAIDVGIDGGAASSEEAAVHDIGAGDQPAETEPPLRVIDPAADAEVEAAESGSPRAFGDAVADLEEATGRHALREDPAALIDREATGAAAPASGRDDVGPGSGL